MSVTSAPSSPDDRRAADLRRRYLADHVETASPARRLLMLIERLLQDLRAAHDALGTGEVEPVHRHLLHAQEIVLVLRDSLAGSDWGGAEPLRAVYGFIHLRLVRANVTKDPAHLAGCTEMVERIRDANAAAAAVAEAGGGPPPPDVREPLAVGEIAGAVHVG